MSAHQKVILTKGTFIMVALILFVTHAFVQAKNLAIIPNRKVLSKESKGCDVCESKDMSSVASKKLSDKHIAKPLKKNILKSKRA